MSSQIARDIEASINIGPILHRVIGDHRVCISPDEMTAILMALFEGGYYVRLLGSRPRTWADDLDDEGDGIELLTPEQHAQEAAENWTDMCQSITCIAFCGRILPTDERQFGVVPVNILPHCRDEYLRQLQHANVLFV